ncbi:GSCFA domain-containing protein [Bacteroidota bacterium]
MKEFRTVIQPEPSKNKINYQTPLMFMGSCFTENIGNKMLELKFPALVNPFGVLYNPFSVRNSLEILIDHMKFTKDDLCFFNDQWLSFNHDTEFSNENQEDCLKRINSSVEAASKHIRNSKFLIISLGTAWVYKHKKTSKVVSNCHKIPSKEFERILLEPADIFVEWSNLINRLLSLNKKLKIIFTVSPIRHWKDGAIQNQLSKSTLILAIHQLIKEIPNIEYFPAYEIMMDDLRDYRFYANDMIHPSNMAIDYIWEQFSKTYFEKETNDIINEVNKILLAENHHPFKQETESHKKFLQNLKKEKDLINRKHPFIKFD